MKETLVRYVNSFSEHPAFPDLPLGMRITSHEGVRFRWVGYEKHPAEVANFKSRLRDRVGRRGEAVA